MPCLLLLVRRPSLLISSNVAWETETVTKYLPRTKYSCNFGQCPPDDDDGNCRGDAVVLLGLMDDGG